jgi:hypothetical protein
MKTVLLITGFLLLFVVEILRVYLIMPFPGSQQYHTFDTAYWIARNIYWLRALGLLLLSYPLWSLFNQRGKRGKKLLLLLLLAVYAATFYLFHFSMEADAMFRQPVNKIFAKGAANKVGEDKLIIGVVLNGEARAYPIQFIGYHHQITDSVGGVPVIVTYCTVCRTGRVYSPVINGKKETFRLVGMDHFNAMFEDSDTKSWWRQATGEAIAGPLKGKMLQEIPSAQMSLTAWERTHPATLVMQPDSNFRDSYDKMIPYEKGRSKSGLTRRDSLSWKDKSWIVGVIYGIVTKAYDWNQLSKSGMIEDSLPGLPLLITLEKDTVSFHAWDRMVNGQSLHFLIEKNADQMTDTMTNSMWNMDGICVEGPLKGASLHPVNAYQEYWHSWRTFHPGTLH